MFRNANAGIFHLENRDLLLTSQSQVDLTAVMGEFEGIAQ